MEVKKNSEVNNERLKIPLQLMGFLFVGGILLASFTYKTEVKDTKLADSGPSSTNNTYEEVTDEPEVEQDDDPVTVEVTPPPSEELVEEENQEEEPQTNVDPGPPPVITAIEEDPLPEAEIIDFPDVEATFPGGAAELQRWISSNVVYPETAIEMEDQGKVYLSFVVEPDGSISNIEVERGISKELDREAKRVVRKMPKWTPGEAGGKKVRTRCRLPIVFTLE